MQYILTTWNQETFLIFTTLDFIQIEAMDTDCIIKENNVHLN
jgi:hypothetical protein